MRAAIYLRVSTDEQAQHGVSLAMQERDCRERCARIGADAVAVYRDEGLSGTSLQRPALIELLADLSQYDLLVVWKLDRLSRSVRGWSEILAQLQAAGVGFCSVSERIDAGSAMGKAMLGVMSVFAELFVDLLRENVRAALGQIAALDAQLDRLTELYLSGAMDVGDVERSARPIREERARLESAMVATAPVDVELWRRVERLGVEGLLGKVRGASMEAQLEFLRSVYSRVDLYPGGRVVLHAHGLPPVERVLPRYYSERRGITDVGF